MNVRELINRLNRVGNKERHVYFYDNDGSIAEINEIDDSISDRVDLQTW